MSNPQSTGFVEISEEDFDAIYKPRVRASGDLFSFDEVKDAPLDTVWTIVEGDEPEVEDDDDDSNEPPAPGWYAVPGFHVVNVMGYVLTEKPWEHTDMQATYFGSSD